MGIRSSFWHLKYSLKCRLKAFLEPLVRRQAIREGEMLHDVKVAAWGKVVKSPFVRFGARLTRPEVQGWYLLLKLPIFRHGEGVLVVENALFVGWWQTWVIVSKLKGDRWPKIDFVDTIEKQGFTIDNPNASGGCACGNSFCG